MKQVTFVDEIEITADRHKNLNQEMTHKKNYRVDLNNYWTNMITKKGLTRECNAKAGKAPEFYNTQAIKREIRMVNKGS